MFLDSVMYFYFRADPQFMVNRGRHRELGCGLKDRLAGEAGRDDRRIWT